MSKLNTSKIANILGAFHNLRYFGCAVNQTFIAYCLLPSMSNITQHMTQALLSVLGQCSTVLD